MKQSSDRKYAKNVSVINWNLIKQSSLPLLVTDMLYKHHTPGFEIELNTINTCSQNIELHTMWYK